MRQFVDNAGRTWVIQIHAYAVKELRDLLDVDLYGLIDDNLQPLGKLLGDPIKLVDVIYCLCSDQAEKAGVTDRDFGRAMAGDSIEKAADAFVEELTDFFPNAQVRANLRKALETILIIRNRLMAEANKELEQLNIEELIMKVDKSFRNDMNEPQEARNKNSLAEKSTPSSGKSLESLESILVPLRSVS